MRRLAAAAASQLAVYHECPDIFTAVLAVCSLKNVQFEKAAIL